MRNGWEIKKLGDLLIKTETVDPTKNPSKEFIYVDVSSVNNERFFIETTSLIKGKDAPSRARKLIRKNDIIFATVRPTLKRIAIVPKELDGQICSTGYFVLRCDVFIYYKLLFYFLQTDLFIEKIEKLQRGASYPAVTDNDVREQLIPIPPLPEQKRIVAILDEAFAAIDKAKANTEKNLQNAKELFESYLQGVFENGGKGWEEKKMEEVCDLITDGTHFSPENTSAGSYKYITAKNIKPYRIDLSNISYISAQDHKEIYARCPVEKGDVLYIKDGATAGIAAINSLNEEFSLLSSVALLKPSSLLLNTFLVYYMNSFSGKKNFLGYIDGAAITRLTLVKIKNVRVPIPPIETQNSFVKKIDVLSIETKKLETIYQQKLNDLEELKKSILQKAFNGELTTAAKKLVA